MPYPWASFGGFIFTREEHSIWGTDAGWFLSPSYARSRPLGSNYDVIAALSIGSAERSFEIILSAARLQALVTFTNTKQLFTDWGRPIPDSRQAFISEVVPLEELVSDSKRTGTRVRKYRTRIALVSA